MTESDDEVAELRDTMAEQREDIRAAPAEYFGGDPDEYNDNNRVLANVLRFDAE